MNPDAIIHAQEKLELCRLAFANLRPSPEYDKSLELHWTNFVMSAGTFYSKLEQGSKTNGKSQAWFGRRKHERKTDPLLRYLHHARNSEEHGLKRITKRANSKIVLKPGASAKIIARNGAWHVEDAQGEIEYPNDVLGLVRVHDDIYGDWFDPPTEHLGKPMKNASPETVAELMISYMEDMLAEATDLI